MVIGLGIYKLNFTGRDISIENKKASDHKNATYSIDGQTVTLKNGVSEIEGTPDSASKIITKYFGNEVKKDLNEDGREDVAFLVTQETGGSGVFFYAVAAINTEDGYIGSDGYLLGDRIAPQTTEISRKPGQKDVVIVNYADRKTGEPMTVRPSVGVSVYLKLNTENMQWGIVVPDFEGEADPARMTLGMKTWDWIKTTYNNDTEVKPLTEKKFTLTFKTENNFSATTDCNSVGGEYIVSGLPGQGNKLSFDKMASTLMYCEGSQESDFTKILGEVESYIFTSKGELILNLKLDSGSVILR